MVARARRAAPVRGLSPQRMGGCARRAGVWINEIREGGMSTKDDELLDEAIGELGAAIMQIIPSDDQIIADHVSNAYAMLLRFKHNRRAAFECERTRGEAA